MALVRFAPSQYVDSLLPPRPFSCGGLFPERDFLRRERFSPPKGSLFSKIRTPPQSVRFHLDMPRWTTTFPPPCSNACTPACSFPSAKMCFPLEPFPGFSIFCGFRRVGVGSRGHDPEKPFSRMNPGRAPLPSPLRTCLALSGGPSARFDVSRP